MKIFKLLLLLFLFACKKEHTSVPVTEKVYANILILGNSITFAPADDAIGWSGNRGMAASVPEKDYVHILTGKFKEKASNATTTAKNIASFERDFVNYEFDKELKPYRDSKPDFIILRIGENVPADFDPISFDKRYTDLISYFTATNPNVRIFAVGSFWTGKDAVDEVMKKHSEFISLGSLGADNSNYSFGLFTDYGVQLHPGDKGMQAIADMIWTGLHPSK